MSNAGTQTILVVDDESGIRDGLKSSLTQMGYDVETAHSGEDALSKLRSRPDISFVLSDFRMPGLSGFEVLKEVKRQSPRTPFVMMTGHGSIHHAVEAMQLGADDYLAKPFQLDDLEKIILKRMPVTCEDNGSSHIISQDLQMLGILKKAERAAKSSAPVLIEGPSGTGKELLARQIHDWSDRKGRPWVALNCAALPAGLLESELFGFERGAFTGAVERKSGKFEQAHTGTLLLDEIGELDPILQAKLLRVLQEGEVDRLGGKKSQKVDVRIIATTNKNLEQLVSEGKFREDLFFRLYGVRFHLPALKDRAGDIPLLAQAFLKRQTEIQNRHLQFGEGVVDELKTKSWPGNVRELSRSIERASVLSENGTLQIHHFEFSKTSPRAMPQTRNHNTQKSIRDMEREIILETLEAHQGNRTHTARALGMSLRTLRHKLKMYREAGVSVDPSYRQNRLGKISSGDVDDAVLVPFGSDLSAGETFAPKEDGEIPFLEGEKF